MVTLFSTGFPETPFRVNVLFLASPVPSQMSAKLTGFRAIK